MEGPFRKVIRHGIGGRDGKDVARGRQGYICVGLRRRADVVFWTFWDGEAGDS